MGVKNFKSMDFDDVKEVCEWFYYRGRDDQEEVPNNVDLDFDLAWKECNIEEKYNVTEEYPNGEIAWSPPQAQTKIELPHDFDWNEFRENWDDWKKEDE